MKLNGQEIPTPRQNMSIDYIEISKKERTITGRLVKDIVAIKRIFSITYQGLTPEQALIFIDAYRSGMAVSFEFEDIRGPETTTVYIQSLPREIYSHKPRYSQNVTITLEEV